MGGRRAAQRQPSPQLPTWAFPRQSHQMMRWEVGKWLWELKSEEWNGEETHLRKAGPCFPEKNGGAEMGRLSKSSWSLRGEAEPTLPRQGRGAGVRVDSGKPLGAPMASGILAHFHDGFPQNCKGGARRLELPKAETNNNNSK